MANKKITFLKPSKRRAILKEIKKRDKRRIKKNSLNG